MHSFIHTFVHSLLRLFISLLSCTRSFDSSRVHVFAFVRTLVSSTVYLFVVIRSLASPPVHIFVFFNSLLASPHIYLFAFVCSFAHFTTCFCQFEFVFFTGISYYNSMFTLYLYNDDYETSFIA